MQPTLAMIEKMNDGQTRYIPVKEEFGYEEFTPFELLCKIKAIQQPCFLFESYEKQVRGRYSYLGLDAKHHYVYKQQQLYVDGHVVGEDPIGYIRSLLETHKAMKCDEFPSFCGGLVGYFAYEYAYLVEPALQALINDEVLFDLYAFDTILCFDHLTKKAYITGYVDGTNVRESYSALQRQFSYWQSFLKEKQGVKLNELVMTSPMRMRESKESFMKKIETIKQHIYEGDIFQAVLSNKQTVRCQGNLLTLYEQLKKSNPSPYMFYLCSDDIEVAGASPETLVKVVDDEIFTFPLAGTRKRGQTEQEDQELEASLLQDDKELAEHNMLVDLARNDIGKVANIGSVEVASYLEVLRYSHVMHLGSTVKAKIKPGYSALDAIHAILPAGTLSGAPKVKAMKILHRLEKEPRGIYGGTIGYLDYNGDLDVCIAIRFASKHNDTLSIQTGAGIVYDSKAESEYEECANKARALHQALRLMQGGSK
ncbi:hypothetical protein A4S06_00840 [Erysipelotrichaceae bacterium MTC7]|nr:hypothetical protein A4S06_00840 [Erysipelotrichaceae bacterium MTC7]